MCGFAAILKQVATSGTRSVVTFETEAQRNPEGSRFPETGQRRRT
jgi:hypothetical protein